MEPLVIVLFVALFVLLAIGAPIGVALAGSSLIYIVLAGTTPDIVVVHRIVNGVDSFPLLAVPFFILAGNLMNTAGITEKIYNFATALVGWLKGGLGHVNVIGSVIFAGMSGTAVADAGGLGTIEIKAMTDHGYDKKFAVGITAASSTIGPIIPPSLPMVIYGVQANTSIGQLFAAGFIPGFIMAGFMMATVAWYAHRYHWGRDATFSGSVLAHTFLRAIPALMTPFLIIGGMSFGWFTPTEAAVAACAWAIVLGVVIDRTIDFKRFLRVSFDTLETTAVVLFIVGASSIFGWILTQTRTTEWIADALLSVSEDPIMILIMINLILLIVGCFLETIAAITILVPVFLPIIAKINVDPVHFGVMMVLNLMIGLLTPPVGMVLFVLARVANMSFEDTVKACAPFLIPLLFALIIVTFVPSVTLYLPTLLYRS
jgi:tripartite ATP-independent transporter DctM subunit